MNINTEEKKALKEMRITLALAWFKTYADNRKKGMSKEEANKQGYVYLNNVAYSMEEVKTLEKLIDRLLK